MFFILAKKLLEYSKTVKLKPLFSRLSCLKPPKETSPKPKKQHEANPKPKQPTLRESLLFTSKIQRKNARAMGLQTSFSMMVVDDVHYDG